MVTNMNFNSAMQTSLIGNVNKAYLLIRKEIVEEENKNQQSSANPFAKVTSLSNALQSGLSDIKKQAGTLSALTGVNTSLEQIANSKGYVPIKVQYNPASITFSGLKGTPAVGHDGTFMDYNRPVETILGMELLFDTMDIQKAFMMNKTSKDVTVGLFKKKASVRHMVELLVGAAVFTSTRWVGFAWNDMLFWGELVNVNATYTMFDTEGEPVRAKVMIRIRQEQVNITNREEDNLNGMAENRKAAEEQWDKQFKALGKKKAKMSSAVSNIMNTNW